MSTTTPLTMPLAEYGKKHGLSPDELIEAVRKKTVKVVTVDGKQHVKLTQEAATTAPQGQSPMNEKHNPSRTEEKQPSGRNGSLRGPVIKFGVGVLLLGVILCGGYVTSAYMGVHAATAELNTATDEGGLETVQIDSIKEALMSQLTLDNTVETPKTREEKIEHVRRYFTFKKAKQSIPSLEGVRSILATGTYERVEQVPATIGWELYSGYRIIDMNRFAVMVNNGKTGDVAFQFRREGLSWQLYRIDLPIN